MSKVTKSERKALEGHPNAKEIMAVLESEVEPCEAREWRSGYVTCSVDAFPSGGLREPTEGCEGHHTIHKLSHWRGKQETDRTGAPKGSKFIVETFMRHDETQKKARAQHGLEFLQRPNRRGPYVRVNPRVKRLVNEAYLKQHTEEWS